LAGSDAASQLFVQGARIDSDQRVIAEITTACGEAATNAIEHAGAGGPFELAGRLNGREVEITVRDRGVWRAERQGDQGRGLALMRALMDNVDVSQTADGTMVRLRRATFFLPAALPHVFLPHVIPPEERRCLWTILLTFCTIRSCLCVVL